jgi:hypothetical protein
MSKNNPGFIESLFWILVWIYIIGVAADVIREWIDAE